MTDLHGHDGGLGHADNDLDARIDERIDSLFSRVQRAMRDTIDELETGIEEDDGLTEREREIWRDQWWRERAKAREHRR